MMMMMMMGVVWLWWKVMMIAFWMFGNVQVQFQSKVRSSSLRIINWKFKLETIDRAAWNRADQCRYGIINWKFYVGTINQVSLRSSSNHEWIDWAMVTLDSSRVDDSNSHDHVWRPWISLLNPRGVKGHGGDGSFHRQGGSQLTKPKCESTEESKHWQGTKETLNLHRLPIVRSEVGRDPNASTLLNDSMTVHGKLATTKWFHLWGQDLRFRWTVALRQWWKAVLEVMWGAWTTCGSKAPWNTEGIGCFMQRGLENAWGIKRLG